MRFSKIANLINASAIHNHKTVLGYFRSLAHRALAPSASAWLFSPQQPTELPQSLCLPPKLVVSPAAHRALCYSMEVYRNREKRNSVIPFSFRCTSFRKNAVCPVRVCLATISPQSPHMVFAPSKPVFPPSAHRALCYSMLYIKAEKTDIGWKNHLTASRFTTCGFQKL
jgi:hypothetical protein